MLSKRPYLIRALYDWTVDQGHVPIIVVDATVSRVQVPQAHVEEGQIHLNISPSAVRYFTMDRAAIAFEARFGGRAESIFVPMRAVIGIYDRDSGSGAQFPPEPDEEFMDDDDAQEGAPKLSLADTGKVQTLRRVSDNRASDADSLDEGDGPPDDDPTPPRPDGKKGKTSRLRIVK
ncbi:MAG: ClpXP protease specificity-enhancing factor [Halothiobacillus sp.]|nr:ClpXP protease specificity-enhancing factor [Halothiobacillus sp.]